MFSSMRPFQHYSSQLSRAVASDAFKTSNLALLKRQVVLLEVTRKSGLLNKAKTESQIQSIIHVDNS